MDYDLREEYFEELSKETSELVDKTTGLVDLKFSQFINCPLCQAGKEHNEVLFIKNGFTFVRCSKCDMIFSNPQVNSNLLGELYRHSTSNDLWAEIQESKKEQIWKKKYFEDIINKIVDFKNKNQNILLDIGCSSGYFLEVLKDYQTTIKGSGVELSKKAFQYAKNKKLNVYNCFLNELEEDLNYDIFTLFGVLEHLQNPYEIFNEEYILKNDLGLRLRIIARLKDCA